MSNNQDLTFLMLMGLIVVVVAVVVVILYLSSRSRRKSWEELASKTGLNFDPGGFLGTNMKISGSYRGRPVILDTYTHTTGVGKNRHTKSYTRLVVAVNNPANISLSLDKEGILDKVGKALGAQDIQLGDEELDRRLLIKGQPEAAVRALLSNSLLRQKLLEARSLNLQLDLNQIRYQKQGVETHPEVLTAWLELAATLADAIERP